MPQGGSQLLASHRLASMFQKLEQNLARLILQFQFEAIPTQLPRVRFQFKHPKPVNGANLIRQRHTSEPRPIRRMNPSPGTIKTAEEITQRERRIFTHVWPLLGSPSFFVRYPAFFFCFLCLSPGLRTARLIPWKCLQPEFAPSVSMCRRANLF